MKKITFLILWLSTITASAGVGCERKFGVYVDENACKALIAEQRKIKVFRDSIWELEKDLRKHRTEQDAYWNKKYGTMGGSREYRDEKLISKLKKKFEQAFGKSEGDGYGVGDESYYFLYHRLLQWYNINNHSVFNYMVNHKKGHKNINKYIDWLNKHPFDPVLWTDLCYKELKQVADTEKGVGPCNPKGGKEVDVYLGGTTPKKRVIYTYGEDL